MTMKLLRFTLAIVGPLASAVGAFGITFVDSPWENLDRARWWIAVFVLGVLASVVLSVIDFRRQTRLEEELKTKSDAGRTEVSEALANVMDDLTKLAPRTPGKKSQALEGIQGTTVSELVRLLGFRHRHGRAVLFVLNDAQDSAIPVAFKGRRNVPDPFVEGTTRGDAALEFMRSSQADICNDVEGAPWDGWEGTGSNYKAFMSAPIAVGDYVYGMITYDVPRPDSLEPVDLDMLEAFATAFGLASAIAKGQERE